MATLNLWRIHNLKLRNQKTIRASTFQAACQICHWQAADCITTKITTIPLYHSDYSQVLYERKVI